MHNEKPLKGNIVALAKRILLLITNISCIYLQPKYLGENRDGKLTIERFLEFQMQLQREILRLEFERKNPDDKTGLITESQFADLILAYADYNVKKKSNVLKRVRKAYKKKKKKQEQYEAGK